LTAQELDELARVMKLSTTEDRDKMLTLMLKTTHPTLLTQKN
jgi:hypothetical protein